MRVRLEGEDREITLDGPLLGRGGEASVYALPGRPELAAKIYHNPTDEHAGKLAAMLAAPPVAPPARGRHVAVAWPVGRLLEPGDGRVVGALMPRIDDARLIWEAYNPGVRREMLPRFDHGSLLRTARNLAAGLQTLHECGYVVGDLNESNVLVTPESLVTLIDADSFQVPGPDRLYRCRVGRPEYTPPELQGAAFADLDRLPQHDSFALAVLVFQLLMQGVHPFAGTTAGGGPDSIAGRIAAGHWPYAWERSGPVRPSPHAPPLSVLPPSVQELLRRCFEDAHADPDLRPSAAQWRDALEEAERELTSCAGNARHVYHRGLDGCPWCPMAKQTGRDPFPDGTPVRHRTAVSRPQISALVEQTSDDRRSMPVNDPLPPGPTPSASPSAPNAVEGVLRAIGAGVERRSWMVWVGMALIGAVAGFLYAVQSALPARPPGP